MVTAAARPPTVRIFLTHPRRDELRSYAALGARLSGRRGCFGAVVTWWYFEAPSAPKTARGSVMASISGVVRAARTATSETSWSGAEAAAEYKGW